MHQRSIEGSTFWAWCAFDVLGIFGALQACGSAETADPYNGEELSLGVRRWRSARCEASYLRSALRLTLYCPREKLHFYTCT